MRRSMPDCMRPSASAFLPFAHRPCRQQLQARTSRSDPRRRKATSSSSRSMPRIIWARADRRIAPRGHPPRPSRFTARRLHVDRGPDPLDKTILRASAISSSATSLRWSPSISPGRLTRTPTSMTSCRCLTPRRRSVGFAIISIRCRTPSGGRCCWKIRRPM